MDHLFSVWNVTRRQWATSTNYSTEEEAERLIRVIKRQVRDEYEVRPRKFGSMRE